MWYKKKAKSELDKLPIPGNCKATKKVDYKAKLDRVFSLYIRLRDGFSNGTFVCVSCGQIKPIREADCGHYINRQHMSTRFSEVNCNAQCRKCNRFDEGNIQGYRRGLIRKYGEQRVLLLEAEKSTTRQYSDFEYKVLIKHYTEEVKKLKKEKYPQIMKLARIIWAIIIAVMVFICIMVGYYLVTLIDILFRYV